MDTVVSIEEISKTKVKVNLESGLTFPLYKGELRGFKLSVGKSIDETDLQQLLDDHLYKRARERAFYLLKSSAKTEHQIYEKLKKAYYPDQVITKVMNILLKYDYINDLEYSKNYIESNSKRKSINIIKRDLFLKGIHNKVVEEAIEKMGVKDENSLNKIIDSKARLYNLNEPKDKRRFIAFLMRRGYSYDIISSALDKIDRIQ